MSDSVVLDGLVGNIQKYSLHDGPGIRTIVFLKGCPLRCLWCANPEDMAATPEPWLDRQACVACQACVAVCPQGLHVLTIQPEGGAVHEIGEGTCLGCGRCVAACPAKALEISGRAMTVPEVLTEVLADEAFYRTSGGGVTVSGGEVLAQPAFARALLAACRDEGLHTAIETSGYAPFAVLESVTRLADLTLYDLKHRDNAAHRRLTGRSNGLILENFAKLLDTGAAVIARLPLIPGVNDDAASVSAVLAFVKEQAARGGRLLGVELLPYHVYGVGKYARLGREYGLAGLKTHTAKELDVIEGIVRASGLPARIVRSSV